jgi:hypothetical protein
MPSTRPTTTPTMQPTIDVYPPLVSVSTIAIGTTTNNLTLSLNEPGWGWCR